MSMLVKLLGAFAPGHSLPHGGRDYVFGRIDQRMKAALTVAYFKRAREAVYLIKGEVEQDDYDRQLGRVMDAYRRGNLNFPGMEAFAYFMGPGLAEMVQHLTGCKEADALTLLEGRPLEVLHLCLCIAYESMGEEDKKKLRSLEGTPAIRGLVALLQPNSPTPSANGSTSSPPSTAPASPGAAST